LWKLDLALIPWLSLLYLCSFLDRTNIGNAKLDGLQEDLRMSNGQYNAALTIFFVSYSVFEPITNVILRWTRPSISIPTIMVLWVSRSLFSVLCPAAHRHRLTHPPRSSRASV
jgi:hypothetical protein